MTLRRTLLASLAAWFAAFPSRVSGFFRDESTEPPAGERVINIHLTWPGVRVNVTGTGFLCVTDKIGTQWSELYGDRGVLKTAFENGIRGGVSRDELPPLRTEALIREAITGKDVELAETVIANNWISREEFEKAWMAYHIKDFDPSSQEQYPHGYLQRMMNEDSYTYMATVAATGHLRKPARE